MKSALNLPLLCLTAVLATSALVAAQDKKDDKKREKVEAVEIGKAAPVFELKDLDGKTVKLADYKDKIVVLEWFQPTCPYDVKGYNEGGNCRGTGEKLEKDGVVVLLVNSSNAKNDNADHDANVEFFKSRKLSPRMLMDPDGKVGHAYGAKSTPHCMVIDAKGTLVYRGAIDNMMEKDAKEKVNYVEQAVRELKAGKPVSTKETRSYG
ncbi:MAG: redoxin domain-containing protein [Planctomycetes bacterium]|nr:redoxin domain-containing protein [Planctomycetota bacterium]